MEKETVVFILEIHVLAFRFVAIYVMKLNTALPDLFLHLATTQIIVMEMTLATALEAVPFTVEILVRVLDFVQMFAMRMERLV